MDNWYTSVDLPELLPVIGENFRKNRKGILKEVVNAKLKPREFKAQENENGITVMKWRDKGDVLLLSTKHSTKFDKRDHEKYKVKTVTAYNETSGETSIDASDASHPLKILPTNIYLLEIELIRSLIIHCDPQ